MHSDAFNSQNARYYLVHKNETPSSFLKKNLYWCDNTKNVKFKIDFDSYYTYTSQFSSYLDEKEAKISSN